jgi:5'-nucleotidase / UDP-sugar diphosphatase
MARWLVFLLGVASLLLACEAPRVTRSREARASSLVLIHTADLHSHLFPERQRISAADAARGLGAKGQIAEVGGFARVARVISEIRAGAPHSLYLDSGDQLEGTAAFSEFGGEPELLALSALGLGAAALGNHDLSPGAEAFARTHRQFADFPVLAANFADNGAELASALAPSVVLDAQGLRVGVIGVANPTSPSGLARADNPYGIELIATTSAVQSEIDRLRARVDVLIALSHLGLDGDQRLISGTTGLDVVLGGHQHLALDGALSPMDCGPALAAERGCSARSVILAHSGALGRYVGELDLEFSPVSEAANTANGSNRWVVASAEHSLIPVSADVADDPALAELLEPYRERLNAAGFETKLCFALGPLERYAENGADSALGNLIADALRTSTGADFALLNSTGIRADLAPGELTRAAFAAVLPFADPLTVLTLSGAQLRALFNQQARVASERKCQTPIQISGLSLQFKCSGSSSSALALLAGSSLELDSRRAYTLATSAYLADGGSGFELLPSALSRRTLDVEPLQALLDAIARLPSCAQSALPCLDPNPLRDRRITLE